jgi:hypothetical protein
VFNYIFLGKFSNNIQKKRADKDINFNLSFALSNIYNLNEIQTFRCLRICSQYRQQNIYNKEINNNSNI